MGLYQVYASQYLDGYLAELGWGESSEAKIHSEPEPEPSVKPLDNKPEPDPEPLPDFDWSDRALAWAIASTKNQRPEWHARAECRAMGTELFFPERGGSGTEGKTVCESCPVVAECLAAGLEGAEHGVWGGTTGRARRKLGRQAA